MAIPTREARLAHTRIHCEYWNEGRREDWLASWDTLAPGSVTMFDPVGTKAKYGLAHATSEAWDMFQQLLRMNMVAVHVNGNEMAWVIECLFKANGETLRTHSIETFAWDADGNLTIKTFYDMPESVGVEDDPYEHLLGTDNVIPNQPPTKP